MAKVMITVWLMQEHENLMRNVIVPEFKKLHPDIEVILTTTSWHYLWDKVVMFSKKKQGPDVLQIGNTWNGVLAKIGALKDMTEQVNKIGGANAFVPAAARLCTFPGTNKMSSVPWYLDVRALYYRKDIIKDNLLREADLRTIDEFEKVCRKIHGQKVNNRTIAALGVSGQKDAQLVHNVAPWIWNFGGEFISQNGRDVHFNSPKSLAGIKTYFGLINNYCDHETVLQSLEAYMENFMIKGDYALGFFGPWVNNTFLNPKNPAHSKLAEHISCTFMPTGVAGHYTFLGGSNLGISAFTQHPDESWMFINHLLKRKVQEQFCGANNQLPSLMDCYTAMFMVENQRNKVLKESVRLGRGFPNNENWAQIEDVLIGYFHQVLVSIKEGIYSDELLESQIQEAAAKCQQILDTN